MAAPGARATFSLWRRVLRVEPSSSPAETSAISAAGCPRWATSGARVAGAADRHDVEGRLADGVHDGRGDLALEVADLAVEAVEHLGGVVVVEGVGPQRAAQPAHRHRRAEPVPLDVAHHEADLAARQREDVVPVAAEVPLGRQVAHRDVHARDRGRRRRQQAALQGQRRHVRVVLDPLREASADLVRGTFEAPGVLGGEGPWRQGPDVQDPHRPRAPNTGTPRRRRTP